MDTKIRAHRPYIHRNSFLALHDRFLQLERMDKDHRREDGGSRGIC
jgi:hypothetical protein